MSSPRSSKVSVSYNGKNITDSITKYIESFQYIDPASGESDTVNLKVENIDKRWIGSWIPKKGDKIKAKIILTNWNKADNVIIFTCGTLMVDDISFSGRPLEGDISAVSIPANQSFKNRKRTKTWEKVSVKALASEIAKRYNIALSYSGDSIKIDSLEQSKEEDSSFLKKVCDKYGLALKIYKEKIVIFDIGKYEDKKTVATITEKEMESWSYNTTLDKTYTGASIEYTDPDKEKDIKVKVGSGSRILEINEKADSAADAERIAIAKINEENRKMTTMSCTIRGNPKIYASSCVKVTGLSKLNGKYYVDKVTHNLDSGYKMSLEMHLVQDRFKANKKTDNSTKYTIKKGDTLWDLARKHYGSGAKYTIIYNANKDIIEAAAQKHRKKSSDHGHWIYPGTVITIP